MWFRNESAVHQYNKEPRADRSVLLSSTAMGASLSTPSPVRALIGQFDRLQLCSKEKKNVDEETSELPAKTPVIVSHQPTPISTAQSGSTEKSTTTASPIDIVENSTESAATAEFEVAEWRTNAKKSEDNMEVHDVDDISSVATATSFRRAGDMRTGEDFLLLLESVRSRLQESVKAVLAELEEVESMPEEAGSSIRLAAGKAQLLVRKKLSKFDELVKKNLNPIDGDPQPATIDDLEGYWALVEIELSDIDECFQKVNELRANGWQPKEPSVDQKSVLETSNNNNNISKRKMGPPRSAPTPVDPSVRAKQLEKQKAAAEMRKKALAEAKLRARAAQQQSEKTANSDKEINSAPRSDVLMVL
ncbi:unnamed protein product [Heligmosomoides polygyrus]|uniref:Disks large-associated protein 5 n=1 Tax=Heligmosomoides polygyrus TaxID=6339 RepID=A0A3P7YJQ1_HELPZ|nr:unnamed protein product [Heligmosomoides polygyrus]